MVDTSRTAHHDEHLVPVHPALNPDQFGVTPIGARSLDRTGSTGGTEMSEDAHHVAGADHAAADLVVHGDV